MEQVQFIDKMNEFNHKRHEIITNLRKLQEEYLSLTSECPEHFPTEYFKGINQAHFTVAQSSLMSLSFG